MEIQRTCPDEERLSIPLVLACANVEDPMLWHMLDGRDWLKSLVGVLVVKAESMDAALELAERFRNSYRARLNWQKRRSYSRPLVVSADGLLTRRLDRALRCFHGASLTAKRRLTPPLDPVRVQQHDH